MEQVQAGTRFIGIPGIFLHHYRESLTRWMRDHTKYGRRFPVWLNVDLLGPAVIGDGSTPSMVPSQRVVYLVGDALSPSRSGVLFIVRPETQKDAHLIEKHCEDLEDLYGIDSSQQWGSLGRGMRRV